MKTILAAALFLLPAVHAFAQTPEETVAFILMDYEDGSTYKVAQAQSHGTVAHVEGTALYTVNDEGPSGKSVSTVTMKADDPCHYEVIYDDGSGKPPSVQAVDMSAYDSFVLAPDSVSHKFTGKCGVKDPGFGCMTSWDEPSPRSDGPRLVKAIAFFKEKVCKGNDF